MQLLHIKNMVCNRCISVVKSELEILGLKVKKIGLGEAEIEGEINQNKVSEIINALSKQGFELIDDKKSTLVEKIKVVIIQHIHHRENSEPFNQNYSDYIAEALKLDYEYLSNLFSSSEGITIEKFIILQKVEKIKELLSYDELTISEIAWKMGYSSVQHLSNQFKKITGITPSQFRENSVRKPLDIVIK